MSSGDPSAAVLAAADARNSPISSELIRILYYRMPVAVIGNVVAGATVALVLRDAVAAPVRYSWLALLLAVVAGRVIFWSHYLRAKPLDMAPWGRHFAVACGITGLVWGAAAVLFYLPQDPALQVFLIIIVGGMGIGSLAVLTSYLPAFYAFFVPAMAPLAAMFIWQGGGFALVLGTMVAVLGGASIALAHVLNKLQTRSLTLRHENRGLLGTLSDAAEAAHSADLAKSAFLASIGHELRTPLNAILGFSEILKDEMFGEMTHPQYRDYARLVHNSAEHLLSIINEILDIAKAEGGKLELEEQTVDPGRVIAICVSLIAARAGAKSPQIAVDVPPDLPRLHADPRRLKQILLNLISNAVKFTPQTGRIEVAARLERGGTMAFTVRDTGAGMTAEDIRRATQLFAHSEAELARKFAGAGIGLPLTKALVELHGGHFEIESRTGTGTVVTVRFPKERVMRGARQAPS